MYIYALFLKAIQIALLFRKEQLHTKDFRCEKRILHEEFDYFSIGGMESKLILLLQKCHYQ